MDSSIEGLRRLHALLTTIVQSELNKHIDVWDLEGADMLAMVNRGESLSEAYSKTPPIGDFGIGFSGISTFADLLALVTATHATYRWIRNKVTRPPLATLIEHWSAQLVALGLDAKSARRVAETFAEQMSTATNSVLTR